MVLNHRLQQLSRTVNGCLDSGLMLWGMGFVFWGTLGLFDLI